MNSLQFLEYLRPALANREMNFSGPDSQTLVHAINRALIDWWDKAPMTASNQPFAVLIPDTRQVTVTVTNGSKVMSCSPAPTTDDIGRSLVIEGDNLRNTILGPTKLLVPFTGQTGSHSASIYGDAVALPAGFQALTGQVWLELTSGSPRYPMFEVSQDVIYFLQPIPYFSASPRPLYFSLSPGQTGDNISPFHIMRFYPLPTGGVRISFDYSGSPLPWTVTDLVRARDLGLEDRAWVTLTDLVKFHLVDSGILRRDLDVRRIDLMRERALDTIAATPIINREPGWVGTEEGY